MKNLFKALSASLICTILLVVSASCDADALPPLPGAMPGGGDATSGTRPSAALPAGNLSTLYDGAVDVFDFPIPTASGVNVSSNERAEIDYSNTQDGYVMVRFLIDSGSDFRARVVNPDGLEYAHFIRNAGEFEVLPLTGGDGEYTIGVFERVEGGRFVQLISVTTTVELDDEFAPFLRPNQNVYFNRGSMVVDVAARLVHGTDDFFERVRLVYFFVVTNIEYDFELAATVQAGYIPDVDAVLVRGRGICFDYASVMTAMLRSLGIPTQLVIGYVGDVYHAWINVYSEMDGWVDALIFFDGNEWHYMDPTFTSTAGLNNEAVRELIGDGTTYHAMRTY